MFDHKLAAISELCKLVFCFTEWMYTCMSVLYAHCCSVEEHDIPAHILKTIFGLRASVIF